MMFRFLPGAVLTASTCFAFVPPAFAQSLPAASVPSAPDLTTSIKINARQAADFGVALKAVAMQARVAIVAEGIPFKATLTDEEAKVLLEPAPVEVFLDRLAKAYDYQVVWVPVRSSVTQEHQRKRPQEHVFALIKQYTTPEDLPDVTPEECLESVKEANSFLISMGPNPPIIRNTPVVLAIANNIPQEMEARLKEGVPVSQLPENVRQQAYQFSLQTYVGMRRQDSEAALFHLQDFTQGTLRYKEENGTVKLGIDNIPAKGNDGNVYKLFVSLKGLVEKAELISGTAIGGSNNSNIGGFSPAATEPDTVVGATTLQGVIEAIPTQRDAVFSVNPILASKSVTVAGMAYAPPRELVDGLAVVYGLRVMHPGDKDGVAQYRLSRPSAPPPRNIASLFDSVRRALPQPLLRATFDGRSKQLIQNIWEQYQNEDSKTSLEQQLANPAQAVASRGRYEKAQEKMNRLFLAGRMLRQAAGRRLQAEAANLAQRKPDGIPFRSLPRSVQSLFAIVSMTDLLDAVNTVPETPDYILNWNNAVISGGPSTNSDDGKPRYTIRFAGRGKDGTLQNEAEYNVPDNRNKTEP